MEYKKMDENYDNYNLIDMECKGIDAGDSFGNIKITDNSVAESFDFQDMGDTRSPVKTGIMLDFSDDDITPKHKMKTISADIVDNNIQIRKNFDDMNNFEPMDYNQIDMETDVYPDDDDEFILADKDKTIRKITEDSEKVFFDDEDDDIFKSVDIEESKKKHQAISYDVIEDDYWEKLKSSYEKKNKNGHNTHFHIAGDPQKEIAMFNNDKKNLIDPSTYKDGLFAGLDSIEASDTIPSSDGLEVAIDSGDVGGASGAGESGGASESFKRENQKTYTKKLCELFDIIGFDVIKNSDNSYVAIDAFDEENPEIHAKNLKDMIDKLKPYIDDCIIYPLQVSTKQNFDKYEEWLDWYANKNNSKKYPKCREDIEYCDIIKNHLNECKL